MTKIIVVGDIHVSDHPPVNCTESYTDDIIEMLTWIADYAVEIEADAVVWEGDVFHHKAPSKNSHALVLRMIEVVKRHRGLLWIVPGNHDLSYDDLGSLHTKQPLGVLYAAGAHELNGWHPTLPLYGVPWQQTWTSDPETALKAFDGFTEDGRSPADSLVVTHAPIYPPALVAQGVPFDLVSTQDLAKVMGGAGSLAYGHIHEDHGIFFDGGVTFANVGAISRGSLTEYNRERQVKVAVWSDGDYDGEDGLDLGEAGGGKVTLLGVPGFFEVVVPHKPASEVFRLDAAAVAKDAALDLEDFLTRVGSAQIDITSTGAVIAHVQGRKDVPERVRTRAVEFLEEADG